MNVSVALSVFECVKYMGKEEAAQTKQNHYFVAGTGEGTAAAWKVGGTACQLISLTVANATK